MRKVRGIIAVDLDGTLLDSNKRLTTRNLYALENAAEEGWEIVPATGRLYSGMPDFIRELPFVNYVIAANGAQVIDLKRRLIVYESEIPYKKAVKLMEWLDEFPVIYDCYVAGKAYMNESHKAKIDQVIQNKYTRQLLHDLREPVADLKAFVLEQQQDVQKVQFFIKDDIQRLKLVELIKQTFSGFAVSSALDENVEINAEFATKGEGLYALAKYIGVKRDDTMAIGDSYNDLPMIHAAGLGIAMSNAAQRVKDEAKWVTLSNDMDGVASAIEEFCLR